MEAVTGNGLYLANLESETQDFVGRHAVDVRIIRPTSAANGIPGAIFFHGVASGVGTHDRLIREIAVAAPAAVVIVVLGGAPEIQFPLALEEAYAATRFA